MPDSGMKDTSRNTPTGATGASRDLSPDTPARPGASPAAVGDRPAPVDTDHSYSGRSSAGAKAQEMKHRTADEAQQKYEEVREFTNEALDKARREFGERGQQARVRLHSMAGEQKDRAATVVDDLCKAARAAVDKLDEQNDPKIAGYARTAAESLEGVRDYLRSADISDLTDDVGRFTRRHPGVVLGGLFVAGLAASRFLKADRHYQPRGRLPEGADESLYEDIYEYQHESHHAGPSRFDRGADEQFPDTRIGARPAGVGVGATSGMAGTPIGTTAGTSTGPRDTIFGETGSPTSSTSSTTGTPGGTGQGAVPLSGEGADTLKGGV